LNVQPVIPISLNMDWNLISRTILPIVYQDDILPDSGDQFGLGDTVRSLFFSPAKPTTGGWIWGAGPVLLLPTGTDDLLGGEKWGAGPTAVALRQAGPWTVGFLGNYIWSFAGDGDRDDISLTFSAALHHVHHPDGLELCVADGIHVRLRARRVERAAGIVCFQRHENCRTNGVVAGWSSLLC
jgi:hypothetical protein